jgi:hypothetical protein
VLATHVACAFATPVVQTLPQLPQSFTLVLVSTHVPPHRSGVLAWQPERQVDPEHTGVPASPEQACPQEPQLASSLVVSTQDPLHAV